jgi:hypothetical protein
MEARSLKRGKKQMRRIQVVPTNGANLYGDMIAKEIELASKNVGTLHRNGPKLKDRSKWSHTSYPGWINLARSIGGVVCVEVRSKKADTEWQLLQSFLGFLDRHFSSEIQSINIQYEEQE